MTVGIVAANDAYVIAVDQGAIDDSDLYDDDAPALARAVLGIGETVLRIVPYSECPPSVEALTREEVLKANGSAVTTTFFVEESSTARTQRYPFPEVKFRLGVKCGSNPTA